MSAVPPSLPPTCAVPDCYAPAGASKGMCRRHYMRQHRGGTAALLGPLSKPCVVCNVIFEPRSNRQKYCSERCRRGTSICETCGLFFQRKSGTAGRFCSLECWYAKPGSTPTKSCPVCGEQFSGSAQTCSFDCGYEWRRINNPKRMTECNHCGGDISRKKAGTKYCSRSCAMQASRNGRGGRGVRLPEGTRRIDATGYVRIKIGNDWILEHRFVVENTLGRKLEAWERVHHRNGRRDDNRPDNLELWKIKGRKDPAGVRQQDYHCPGCRCSE